MQILVYISTHIFFFFFCSEMRNCLRPNWQCLDCFRYFLLHVTYRDYILPWVFGSREKKFSEKNQQHISAVGNQWKENSQNGCQWNLLTNMNNIGCLWEKWLKGWGPGYWILVTVFAGVYFILMATIGQLHYGSAVQSNLKLVRYTLGRQ